MRVFYCYSCKGLHRVNEAENVFVYCPINMEIVRQMRIGGLAMGYHGTDTLHCRALKSPIRVGDWPEYYELAETL